MRNGIGLPITGSPGAPLWWLGGAKGADAFFRFDDKFGAGGLYHSEGGQKAFADVIANPPAGEPTSAGMLVDGSDAPTLVQGSGPNLARNPNFDVDLSEWTEQNASSINSRWVDGQLEIQPGVGSGGFWQEYVIPAGSTIEITASMARLNGTSARMMVYEVGGFNTLLDSVDAVTTDLDTYTLRVSPSVGGVRVYFTTSLAGGSTIRVDNVTAKLVLPYADYSGTEHTVKVVWDADGATGDRVVFEARKDANNREALHFVSGLLRYEAYVGGVSQGYVAVPGIDDGGVHSAVMHRDEVAGTLSLDVDGQGLEGPEIVTNGGFDLWTDPTIPDGWTKSNHNATNYCEQSPPGSMRLISVDTNTGVVQYTLTPGVVYEFAFTDVVVTTGNMAIWYGSLLQQTIPAGNSSTEIIPSGTNYSLKRVPGATDVSIGGISGKAIYSRSGLTLPTGLTQYALGHLNGANQLNGLVLEHAAANGNLRSAWAA